MSKEIYRFDEFALEPSRRLFSRQGTPVTLSPKAFEVLAYLVMNPGRVVTKDELLKAVWPESFVDENNLNQHISALRKVFAGQPAYIVTVPGRGYHFAATVREEQAALPIPEEQLDEILIQRVRERARIVMEETTILPIQAPVAAPQPPAARKLSKKRFSGPASLLSSP